MSPSPRLGRWCAQACGLWLTAALAHAQTPPPEPPPEPSPLRLSGFGTLGVSHMRSPNDRHFVRGVGQDSHLGIDALYDSRLGLQANWTLQAGWEATGQVTLRKREPQTSALESLTLAHLSHTVGDNTWRLGRTAPDMFLLSASQNVHHAMPWARPPAPFYRWMPFESFDGVEWQRDWSSRTSEWRLIAGYGHSRVTAVNRTDHPGLPLTGQGPRLSLTRESGNLLVKATLAQVDTRLPPPDQLGMGELTVLWQQLAQLPLPPGMAAEAARIQDDLVPRGRTRYASLSLQYDTGPWHWIGEASYAQMQHGQTGAWRAYLGAAYRWGDVTAFGTAGVARPLRAAPATPADWADTLAPMIGPDAAAAVAGAIGQAHEARLWPRFDKDALAAGLRWDLQERMALKTQVETVWHRHQGAAHVVPSNNNPARTTTVSVGLDFTF